MAALGALAASAVPAAGERLVASLSNHRVMITSNFTGDELVLFGGIEQDAASRPRRGGYDIVVTVTGPRQTVVTFRKERSLGIWVNADSRVLENAPAYLAVLSNRPLDAITNTETLRRLQFGLDNFPLPQRASVNIADASSDDPFRLAFIKIKTDQGLYREVSNGVTFLTPALFRALDPVAGRSAGRDLRGGCQAVRRRGADRTRTVAFRGLQIGLRADRHHRGARAWPALWPCHRNDGDRYRLVRLGGVQAGLRRWHQPFPCEGCGRVTR